MVVVDLDMFFLDDSKKNKHIQSSLLSFIRRSKLPSNSDAKVANFEGPS